MGRTSAIVCAAIVGLLTAAPATAQQWNDARVTELVNRATERRARQLADTGLTDYTATAAVSSDGSRAVIVRGYDRGEREQSVIVPIAGDGEVVEILCDAAGLDGCEGDWVWSPDDTTLLGRLDSGGYVIADPATGQVTTTDWDGTGMPAWQRIGSITD